MTEVKRLKVNQHHFNVVVEILLIRGAEKQVESERECGKIEEKECAPEYRIVTLNSLITTLVYC